ncbi:MAG: glycosyl transferase [Bacilli bacterium]|nr:glycosyl transferase [Bacilli bacterium]
MNKRKQKYTFKKLFFSFRDHGFLNWINDKTYLKICYKIETGERLNLKQPKTFNEKLQWLKLYYRKKDFSTMVDKYDVKKIISEKIGEQYVIPSIGIYNSFDEIDFDILPNQFVIKLTHNSGGVVICKNKNEFEPGLYKEKFKNLMKQNYFYRGREWPYKNVKPRILVETYMKDGNYDVLPVYKVLNFGGEPKLIQVILNDKTKNETVDYYDVNWKKLDIRQNFPNSSIVLPKPKKLDEILNLARKLSADFPHIRTDFYIINNKVYFSEYTFFSDCGFKKFIPNNWDLTLGNLIELPPVIKG